MKKLTSVLLALVLVLALGATALADDALTVAFSQIGQESDWRTANTDDVCKAIQDAGWNLVYDDAQQKQENQVKALRNFITQGVDYIVFTAIVTTGWDEVLKEVQEAEIPLVLIDRFPETSFADDSWYTTYFGGDFPEEGARAARWIVNYFKSIGRGDEEINIVRLEGTTGADAQVGRSKGFDEEIAKTPNFKIVASQTGNFTGAEGQAVMESFLKSVSKIDVLWAENDNMALGAIEAIKAAGLQPGKDIIIVGCDAVKLAFEAIVNGEMNCTVECTPLMGNRVVEVIKGLEAGETFDKVVHPVEYVYDFVGGIPYTADGAAVTELASEHIAERLY
ncbi:MAG: ABC transporter substrate-binding protein [Clostridiales bacterium]|nr:ABC transporter substrate-binding protein [Clostridiales bacterium]